MNKISKHISKIVVFAVLATCFSCNLQHSARLTVARLTCEHAVMPLGIETSLPALGWQIIIRPEPVGDITCSSATYESLYGKIVSEWKKEGTVFI